MTIIFPEDFDSVEKENIAMRCLNVYLFTLHNRKMIVVGYERCPTTQRLHAHVLLTFERTMRLTQALRHMYLPGIGKEVHPFIQALRTQEDQARVIQYIFKKYSKIRGGELRKDTFVHGDEEDLVGRVLRGEVSTAPKPSSARQIFENNELQIRQGNYTR